MKFSQNGQALIEYLLVIVLVSFIATKAIKQLGSFMGSSAGNLAHQLSQYLTVGVCARECYFDGYKNGANE